MIHIPHLNANDTRCYSYFCRILTVNVKLVMREMQGSGGMKNVENVEMHRRSEPFSTQHPSARLMKVGHAAGR